MEFADLGRIGFDEAYELQLKALSEVLEDGVDRLQLLEHPHIFTLGRSGREENLLAESLNAEGSIEIRRINRGGDVTYHGPGQLVGYPHFDLRRRGRDLHRFLRNLEEVLIRTSTAFGVQAYRREGLTGVWTDDGKLASIGIGVRQWITLHGFALNVATDLRYFDLINPCGIRQCPVTSLESLTGAPISMPDAKKAVCDAFVEVFEV